MAKDGYTSVRIKDALHARILEVRSPGETIAGCIERAVSVLVELKDISRRFHESPEYQAYQKRKEEHSGD